MRNPRINLDIIIEKDNKILLGKISKKFASKIYPCYGLPGNDLKFGETFEHSVNRQLRSELSLKMLNFKIISINSNYALNNHYIGIGIVAKVSGEVKNNRPDLWEEWAWFNKNKLPKNLFPGAKNQLKSYLNRKITVSR